MDIHRIGFREVVERIRRCEERDEIAVHQLPIHRLDIARGKFGGVKLVEMHCGARSEAVIRVAYCRPVDASPRQRRKRECRWVAIFPPAEIGRASCRGGWTL